MDINIKLNVGGSAAVKNCFVRTFETHNKMTVLNSIIEAFQANGMDPL